MSAAPKIIEGTWEEILRHAPELAGHRLRITVMDGGAAEQPSQETAPDEDIDAWVRRLYDWAYNRPALPTVIDDSRDSIYGEQLDHQL